MKERKDKMKNGRGRKKKKGEKSVEKGERRRKKRMEGRMKRRNVATHELLESYKELQD